MPSRRWPPSFGQRLLELLPDQSLGDAAEVVGIEGAQIDDVEIHGGILLHLLAVRGSSLRDEHLTLEGGSRHDRLRRSSTSP